MMSRQPARFWTFNTLVGAFLDLFVAYFLLCGSTIAFFADKFLGFFGFSLSTPYNVFFDSDFTNLLFDYPTDKISDVQFAVARKFPFDSIFFRIQNGHGSDGLNLDRGDGFRELEVRFEKGRGFDMKGKGAANYRVRGSIRRRRKTSLDSGKHSSVSTSPTWITCVEDQNNHKESNAQLEGSLILSGANSSNYEAETPMVVKSDGRFLDDVSNESGNNPSGLKERIATDDGDEDNRIVSLTQELEVERAARSALYVELDEERNAAATAADEAMAMILRLQEEKASIEMESRQYKRMIEEKSAYDLEEMNILKEILLRREREKHFLEKEVEAYRQMDRLENDQLSGINVQDFNEDPDLILHELSMSIANRKNSGNEDLELSKREDIEKPIAIVGEVPDLEMKAGHAFNGNKELYKQRTEKESLVYNVHMIDNEPKTSDESKGSKKRPTMDETDGSFLRRLEKEADQNRSGSEAAVGRLPPISSKSARRNSTSVLDNERIRIDTEVGWLRERLRIVQEGREKLNFSINNREKESLQLQLLEDIARQLQEIRMLTEPRKARQASLPLPSSKSLTKKRRCRSVSSGAAKSS
ncbi:myosin-binding protein 2-like isoform X2 [Cynara cardunculus var. scolymus]|uniref:myosin-binding protein 2-like isoform X2 n=1 Tax=Cynara cardunculus var. scolymus TaxID=59895 RepID=UPI000D6251F4|nr:myosin-binding protein 2-like isoform X2 [Cynara cardunculus var. scolymus]